MTLLCALASVLWLNEKNKKNFSQSIIIIWCNRDIDSRITIKWAPSYLHW